MANNSRPAPSSGDSIRSGRRAPTFVMTPEWIVVAGLSPQAVALYTALLAHVNRQRDDGVAWPGMDVLAQLLGFRRRQSIARYIDELEAVDAITVARKQACATGWRNEYVVHEMPPEAYEGPTSLAEFYARRRGVVRSSAHGVVRPSAQPVVRSSAHEPDEANQTNEPETSGDAYAAVAHEQARGPMTIMLPRGFDGMDEGHAHQALVRCALGALTGAGLTPAPNAANLLGDFCKQYGKAGWAPRKIVAELERGLGKVGTTEPGWGTLATSGPRAA